MLKKYLFIVSLIILTLWAYGKGSEFELKGKIVGTIPRDSTIYIHFEKFRKEDSLHAFIKNGEFTFRGQTSTFPVLLKLHFKGKSLIIDIYVDSRHTYIQCTNTIQTSENSKDTLNILKLDQILGSSTTNAKLEFEYKLAEIYKSYKNEYLQKEKHYSYLRDFISKHRSEKISVYILSRTFQLSYDTLKKLASLLHIRLKTTAEYEDLTRLFNDLNKSSFIGTLFRNDTLLNDRGFKSSVAETTKKFKLINFWASWCIPCRKENPQLLRLLNEAPADRFALVGISFDTEIQPWKVAMVKDSLPQMQFLDTNGIRGTLAKYYGISSIPSNLLLNENNVIIGVDVSLNEIRRKVLSH